MTPVTHPMSVTSTSLVSASSGLRRRIWPAVAGCLTAMVALLLAVPSHAADTAAVPTAAVPTATAVPSMDLAPDGVLQNGLLHNGLLVGALLFALGLVGILTRRNMIVMFLSAELMLQGVSVSLVSWSRYHGDWGGQMLVIFVLTVAACEAAVALVFVLQAFSRTGRLDANAWQSLRESVLPRTIDQALPPLDGGVTHWPTLTPAGVEPAHDEEALLEREHV
jgi:NADH-quinone oxidoreductase subunit K